MGKLLFVFSLGQGHVNVCLNIGKLLLAKYPEHEVYFNVNEEFKKKVQNSSHLFKPVVMDKSDPPNPVDPVDEKDSIEQFRLNFYKTGLKKYIAGFDSMVYILDKYIMAQDKIEKVIDQVKPDVILMDQLFNLPFVENKGLPWYLSFYFVLNLFFK